MRIYKLLFTRQRNVLSFKITQFKYFSTTILNRTTSICEARMILSVDTSEADSEVIARLKDLK